MSAQAVKAVSAVKVTKLGASAVRLKKLAAAGGLLFKKLVVKKVVAGVLFGTLALSPAMHASTTSGGGSGGGTTTTQSGGSGGGGGGGGSDSGGGGGSAKSGSTTKTGPAITIMKDGLGEAGVLLGLRAKNTSKVATAGGDIAKIGAVLGDTPTGLIIQAVGDGIELAAPRPKTVADRVNDVVKVGETALRASRTQGADAVSHDMIRAVSALNVLSHQPGTPPAVAELVTAYQKAIDAGPDTKLAADQAVVAAYEKVMQANGFQVNDTQRATIGAALAKLQTMSDPGTEKLYSGAITNFETFMRDSQNDTGTPIKVLTKAVNGFAQADQSATPLVSAKTVGGVHLYNAAVALRAYRTAKAAGDTPGMAKQMATILAEGQLAVQAKHPGYTTIAIDPDAVAAAVANATAPPAAAAPTTTDDGTGAGNAAPGKAAPSDKGGGKIAAATPAPVATTK